MVNMGHKLKKLRIEKKLTQKQVAERTGVAVSAISSYESGDRYPSYVTLVKLASMYHVSCDYLVGLSDTRTLDVTGLNDNEIEVISNTIDAFRHNHTGQ